MKISATLLASVVILTVSACATKQQGDANQVSIRHGTVVHFDKIFNEASKHCAAYGRQAVLQGRFSPQETIFRCEEQ